MRTVSSRKQRKAKLMVSGAASVAGCFLPPLLSTWAGRSRWRGCFLERATQACGKKSSQSFRWNTKCGAEDMSAKLSEGTGNEALWCARRRSCFAQQLTCVDKESCFGSLWNPADSKKWWNYRSEDLSMPSPYSLVLWRTRLTTNGFDGQVSFRRTQRCRRSLHKHQSRTPRLAETRL
jgi:hypothetical protein